MKSPVFSLIVPTLNRTEDVRILFTSLTNQVFTDFEVIVVDQNADDRLVPIVASFTNKLKITHLKETPNGASAARNAGLRIAKGDIITCPDDDCEYPSTVLQRVYDLFKEHDTWSGITVWSTDKNAKGGVSRMATKESVITRLNILTRSIEFGIFVRAGVAKGTFFDEDLGVGSKSPWWSDEGPDFVLRLMEQGHLFMYVPSIVIHHPNPVAVYDEKAMTRSYRYGLGRGRFLKKHRYPIWFVMYVWALYVAGIGIGVIQLNGGKMKYYYRGLRGRIKGYLSK